MPENTPALVVVAAGGLGTRVHGWTQFIPKEFYPVDGRPGIVRLLEEIAGLGPARVAVVYHPYYEQFAAWSRQVLGRDAHDRYARQAGMDIPAAVSPTVTVSLIPQQGAYGDLTSVINGADCLAAVGGLFVAFADNLYTGPAPLPLLRAAPGDDVAVLASRYRPALAPSRGILITSPGSGAESRQVETLIEKPDPAEARALEEEHGTANLLILEGRARLRSPFLRFARSLHRTAPDREPKLSMAIGTYARDHQVIAVPAPGDVIDLGAPDFQSSADAGLRRIRQPCRSPYPKFQARADPPRTAMRKNSVTSMTSRTGPLPPDAPVRTPGPDLAGATGMMPGAATA